MRLRSWAPRIFPSPNACGFPCAIKSRPSAGLAKRLRPLMDYRAAGGPLFKDPRWPLTLGEDIAQQEGWIRADVSPEENGAEWTNKTPAPPQETQPPGPPQEAPK